eukprot:TRINITY_DN10829_c0_g2_i1.p1 TRINITY_DN10829_c0_g2~~TRINITY_DN10829_c0_g2_i1.p1  ORF type:complete len:155 (+),score=22.83 TRINITY_DN10829_c0_g2_i1:59-523(+)
MDPKYFEQPREVVGFASGRPWRVWLPRLERRAPDPKRCCGCPWCGESLTPFGADGIHLDTSVIDSRWFAQWMCRCCSVGMAVPKRLGGKRSAPPCVESLWGCLLCEQTLTGDAHGSGCGTRLALTILHERLPTQAAMQITEYIRASSVPSVWCR